MKHYEIAINNIGEIVKCEKYAYCEWEHAFAKNIYNLCDTCLMSKSSKCPLNPF